MRISTELYQAKGGASAKVGEFWTNGTSVFYTPSDSGMMRSILNDDVYDVKRNRVVSAQSDPIAWVRNLWLQYKSQALWATEPREE